MMPQRLHVYNGFAALRTSPYWHRTSGQTSGQTTGNSENIIASVAHIACGGIKRPELMHNSYYLDCRPVVMADEQTFLNLC